MLAYRKIFKRVVTVASVGRCSKEIEPRSTKVDVAKEIWWVLALSAVKESQVGLHRFLDQERTQTRLRNEAGLRVIPETVQS
jgi:hypothetical protein